MASGSLLSIDDARGLVLGAVEPLPAEEVALDLAARGRVLAQDITATAAVPAFDSSAMDGFAVRASDTREAAPQMPATLAVVDESRAGAPAVRTLAAGEAIAISTGAMIPDGADAVVRVEDTRCEDARVRVLARVAPGEQIRRAGEDIRAGRIVLRAGTTLGAAELGVLASLGQEHVGCTRRARVALVVTGDELIAPGEEARAGSVRDSNSLSVGALVLDNGAELVRSTRVGDDADATRAAIADALLADVVVICGGVSVGIHDHVRPSLAALGAHELFWGVALRPGKPTWCGTAGRTLVFGLPGNPVSTMVTFALFVVPALQALTGARAVDAGATAALAGEYLKPAGRAHALRVRLRDSAGGWQAEPMPAQGSHVLTSMLGADALAIIPAERERVAAGERVRIERLDACRSA